MASRWKGDEDDLLPDPAAGSLVRPYAVTGGRTAPKVKLPLEALVWSSTAEARELSHLLPEYQAISQLCRHAHSVAEVSALLRMPLGVVRVLIADMAAEDLVRVHQPQLEAGRPDVNLLERVLSGLRNL